MSIVKIAAHHKVSQYSHEGFMLFFSMFLVIAGTTLVLSSAHATTFYVDGSSLDDLGSGAGGSPKKYISSGVKLMRGGDTLIIKNGIYKGAHNAIGDYAMPRIHPPSGSPSGYTVIKAEHVGGVIIDGEYLRFPFSTQNKKGGVDYLRIEGIHFRHGKCGVFALKGNYNKVIKSGFEDGMKVDSTSQCPIAFIAGGSSYSLIEDSWAWGRGRYGIYTNSNLTGTHHIVFRRLVIRLDDTPNWVCAGTRFYKGDSNSAQNVLVIDSTPNNCSFNEGAFAMGGGSSRGEPNHTYNGILALNNAHWSGLFPDKSRQNTNIKNAVFWGNGDHGLFAVQTSQGTINLNHISSGKNLGSGLRSRNTYPLTENITNAISYSNKTSGFEQIDSVDTVNVFGHTVDCASCTILNGITSDPMTPASGLSAPALRYLVRIENGSNLKGAASDSGDIGATLLKKVGTTESLSGEPGWNQTSNDPLWPWPDEKIWLPKMRGYSASGLGGNRGFAATGQTLTNYIWGYFNYDNDLDTPAVTVPPFNIIALAGNQMIHLSWDKPAPITLPNISEFRVYDVTGMTQPIIPGTMTPVATISGNTTYSANITGLINGKTYDFAVTAISSGAGGESSYSYIISGTPQPLSIISPVTGFYVSSNNMNHFTIKGRGPIGGNIDVAISYITAKGGGGPKSGSINHSRLIGSTTADTGGNWTLLASNLNTLLSAAEEDSDIKLTATYKGIDSTPIKGKYNIIPPAAPTGITGKNMP